MLLPAACTPGSESTEPEVISVTILDENRKPFKTDEIVGFAGGVMRFHVDIKTKNGASDEIQWIRSGGNYKSSINDGLFTIAGDENFGAVLTVTVFSVFDFYKSDSIDIKIGRPGDYETIEGIKLGDVVEGKGTLVWRDEFNSDALDRDKWNYDYGNGSQYGLSGWGNNERQMYREENVRVDNGKLIIEVGKGTNTNFPYTSGKITTKGTKIATASSSSNTPNHPAKEFLGVTQGYVEARIKTPKGVGFWPAFWMLSANTDGLSGYPSLGWPQCGEIDILETVGGKENLMHHTIHYGENPFNNTRKWQKGTSYTISPGAGDAYNIYGVGWSGTGTSGTLKFFFNNEVKFTQSFPLPEGAAAHSESFFNDIPWVIILNVAVGGSMGGGTPSEEVLTGSDWETRSMMVDWVRVYQ